MHEDDPKDKAADDNIGEKNQLDNSDIVLIFARQLQLGESTRKGNHDSGHGDQTNSRGRVTQENKTDVRFQKPESQMDKDPFRDSNNRDEDVDEVHQVSDDSSGSLSMNNLQRRLNAKKERAKAEKARPRGRI
uniref:Uncharacterized protein n=1 Tax=Cannabis sativa TaxID=3483 RepID=A0A803NL03_CANSA